MKYAIMYNGLRTRTIARSVMASMPYARQDAALRIRIPAHWPDARALIYGISPWYRWRGAVPITGRICFR